MSKFTRLFNIAKLPMFGITFLVILLLIDVSGQKLLKAEPSPLAFGKPVERELKTGEVHTYLLRLEAGQLLSVFVEQKGVNVVVVLLGSEKKEIMKVDSLSGKEGVETVSIIADKDSEYQLEISSPEKSALTIFLR